MVVIYLAEQLSHSSYSYEYLPLSHDRFHMRFFKYVQTVRWSRPPRAVQLDRRRYLPRHLRGRTQLVHAPTLAFTSTSVALDVHGLILSSREAEHVLFEFLSSPLFWFFYLFLFSGYGYLNSTKLLVTLNSFMYPMPFSTESGHNMCSPLQTFKEAEISASIALQVRLLSTIPVRCLKSPYNSFILFA